VICQSGARSAIARSILLAHGRRAINVEGGMIGWLQAGLPYVQGV
jgi:rhodanese-related sulfurtransferase